MPQTVSKMEEFSCMKITDLRIYLRARGIVVGQEGQKELAERAFWARELGLKEKVNDRVAEERIEEVKQDKLILDGGMVRLPRPESCTSSGWEMNPTSLPDTTRADIDQYIRTAGRRMGLNTDSVKTFGLGKGLHMSNHVQDVCYHGINPNLSYCFVRARVIPQTSTNAERYYTWVVLNKDNGGIITGECNCIIGIQGACKHITALLFTIAEAVEEDRNMASTSQKMAWGVPKVKKYDGVAKHVQEIKIVKVKPDTSNQNTDEEQRRKVYRSSYDPRAVAYRVRRPVSDFDLDRLAEITGGKTGLLMYNKPEEDLRRQIPNITDINGEEEVSTTVEAPTVESSILQSTIPEADNIMENLKITRHQQISLATSTATQASNPKWHQHRRGRITASVAAECAAKVTTQQIKPGHSCVAKIMGYYGKVTSSALQWGRDMEPVAKRQYIADHKSKRKHQSISCHDTGLWISLQHSSLTHTNDTSLELSS